MTEKQFFTILESLADKIKDQENTISFQKVHIESLKKSLKEAEEYLETLKKGN